MYNFNEKNVYFPTELVKIGFVANAKWLYIIKRTA